MRIIYSHYVQTHPKLVVVTKDGKNEVSGPKDIQEEIKSINKAIREASVSSYSQYITLY